MGWFSLDALLIAGDVDRVPAFGIHPHSNTDDAAAARPGRAAQLRAGLIRPS
jgi:hypothetical protein